MATRATTLKMKAPTNVDNAFCDTSSAITRGNARGVAVVLAEEYAATMEATAKVAMASMLAAMMDRRLSNEPFDTSGARRASGKVSDTLAPNTAMIETAQINSGLTHKRSRMRRIRKRHFSSDTTHFMCTPPPCSVDELWAPQGFVDGPAKALAALMAALSGHCNYYSLHSCSRFLRKP